MLSKMREIDLHFLKLSPTPAHPQYPNSLRPDETAALTKSEQNPLYGRFARLE